MKLLILMLLSIVIAGCATTAQPASTRPSAQCLVCEKNADLACIEVTVDANTPRYDYAGKTYYFCSEECRDKFAKNPSKFVK